MSNPTLRKEVLQCFKSLHRAREQVFGGDAVALKLGRNKINDEYKKHKDLTDENKVVELIKHSKAVEDELKTTIIQAEEVKPGLFKARIRPEVLRLDNVPYKEMPG